MAYIAYAKGFCDDKLIAITNDNSMFKQQARYLDKHRQPELRCVKHWHQWCGLTFQRSRYLASMPLKFPLLLGPSLIASLKAATVFVLAISTEKTRFGSSPRTQQLRLSIPEILRAPIPQKQDDRYKGENVQQCRSFKIGLSLQIERLIGPNRNFRKSQLTMTISDLCHPFYVLLLLISVPHSTKYSAFAVDRSHRSSLPAREQSHNDRLDIMKSSL